MRWVCGLFLVTNVFLFWTLYHHNSLGWAVYCQVQVPGCTIIGKGSWSHFVVKCKSVIWFVQKSLFHYFFKEVRGNLKFLPHGSVSIMTSWMHRHQEILLNLVGCKFSPLTPPENVHHSSRISSFIDSHSCSGLMDIFVSRLCLFSCRWRHGHVFYCCQSIHMIP